MEEVFDDGITDLLSRCLTHGQLYDILRVVNVRHGFYGCLGTPHCKMVKYVVPIYDQRFRTVHRITFRGMFPGSPKIFDFRDPDERPMYTRITEWFDQPR